MKIFPALGATLRGIASVLALVLLPFTHSFAVDLYRYLDDDGVPTLSRSLPPEAAQKGYDVLDSRSMRLIRRVEPADSEPPAPSPDTPTSESDTGPSLEALRQAAVHEALLLQSYGSVAELIRISNADLRHRRAQIEGLQAEFDAAGEEILAVMQQAAMLEINGQPLTDALLQQLDQLEQQRHQLQQTLQDLETAYADLAADYADDIATLQSALDPSE